MGNKTKSIHAGKMKVVVPTGYKIYEKEIPNSLKDSPDFKKYDWIGNFGFTDTETGKKVKNNLNADYEIQVEMRKKKQLVYWNGKKAVKFKTVKEKKIGGSNFITTKMRKGDPPVGWTL